MNLPGKLKREDLVALLESGNEFVMHRGVRYNVRQLLGSTVSKKVSKKSEKGKGLDRPRDSDGLTTRSERGGEARESGTPETVESGGTD